ncbi:hypothetical protein RRG08_056264 [Elysia crispata]|uniref:Uncharacterized protein n=1 Tax=Elysia crispata TaxID=231223 RepID=A0AAE1AXP4_9GAST|nr:hypothetical protein RRG08_056264 [Elysia crispata]
MTLLSFIYIDDIVCNYIDCHGEGSNPMALVTCGFSFTDCNALCNTQCGFTTVADVVDTLAGSFAGGPM